MQPLYQASLQVKTLDALTDVLLWFDQFKRSPVPDLVWMQCQIAVAEGFTNAVRHAHKGNSTLPVDLEGHIFADWLVIKIWDCGEPFDLHQALKATLISGLIEGDDREPSEGGRGIKLMWRIADLFRYTRQDDRNCLLILKRYSEF